MVALQEATTIKVRENFALGPMREVVVYDPRDLFFVEWPVCLGIDAFDWLVGAPKNPFDIMTCENMRLSN
jgi:hypothetical protein